MKKSKKTKITELTLAKKADRQVLEKEKIKFIKNRKNKELFTKAYMVMQRIVLPNYMYKKQEKNSSYMEFSLRLYLLFRKAYKEELIEILKKEDINVLHKTIKRLYKPYIKDKDYRKIITKTFGKVTEKEKYKLLLSFNPYIRFLRNH